MDDSSLYNEDKLTCGDELLAATEQYNKYAEVPANVRNARMAFHTLFITIDSMVFAGIWLSIGNGEAAFSVSKALLVYANIVGVTMSIIWFVLVMKYRNEGGDALELLCQSEKNLTFKFFTMERKLKCESSPFTRKIFKFAEPSIPWIFAAIHAVIGLGIWSGSLNFFGVAL